MFLHLERLIPLQSSHTLNGLITMILVTLLELLLGSFIQHIVKLHHRFVPFQLIVLIFYR
jgi:hypothetical protein